MANNTGFAFRSKENGRETLVRNLTESQIELASLLLRNYITRIAKIKNLEEELKEETLKLFPVTNEECTTHIHHKEFCTPESPMGMGTELCLRCGTVICI
jgi:hypothetical protein